MARLMLQIVGVIFPVMIMALVPIRQYIMPYIFSHHTLHELDAAEYEEAPAIADEAAAREAADNVELVGKLGPTGITSSFCIFIHCLFLFLFNNHMLCMCSLHSVYKVCMLHMPSEIQTTALLSLL